MLMLIPWLKVKEDLVQMKAFIVDDSDLLRERVIGLISEIDGVEIVGETNSMLGAVDKIKASLPDVLILDIHMKEGNGIEILKRIRRTDLVPIVIMLTNYPYPQYREKCEAAGANFFLHKATEFQKLVDIIEELSISIKS